LRGAAFALAITMGFGAALVAGLVTGQPWPIIEMTHVHAAWGLGGWALLLLAGVAVIVVPMFQMTPPYPPRVAKAFPWLVIGCLLLWTGQLAGVPEGAASTGLLVLLVLAATFCGTTLRLQARRRRKVDDANVLLMRSAIATGLVAAALCAWLVAGLPGQDDYRLELAAGVLLIAPFVFAINGMLYKIVPFLCWLHLNRHGGPRALPPNMNRFLAASTMGRQARTQLGAFALLLAACLWPSLTRPAGVALVVSFAWLGWNLASAVSVYLVFRRGPSG
jgi:Kef-type K+ transport system membrane component KefB